MEKEKLLDYIAPCSLLCYTCMAFKDGAIPTCARKLHTYSDGYCELRSAHLPESERETWHREFQTFHDTLGYLGMASCPGCRNDPSAENGCFEGCVIPVCVKERGLNFCAECEEFPCRMAREFLDRQDDKVGVAWETGSRRIREVGAEAYFEEKKDTSQYQHYKEKAE